MKPEQKEDFKRHMAMLFQEMKSKLGIKTTPKVLLVEDQDNANNILGGTGSYDKENNVIRLYITDRHPKDVLKTFCHECIHLYQAENNKLNATQSGADPKYAQNDPVLRRAEVEAYGKGGMMFRDWEDEIKHG